MNNQFDPHSTFFIIDGSSFLYRAYYSLRPLHTIQGTPVQAVYSFCRMLKKLMNTYKPEFMALVWDSKGTTERHIIFSGYKATRQEPPSDLFAQKKLIQEFAEIIELAQVERAGVEADDLMYSLALDASKMGMKCALITSDKDMGQVISDNVVMIDPFKDQIIDREAFEKKMLFPVEKLPFYFALVGDTSDNIPGVKGIGPKTATELVIQFDSLEHLYQQLVSVKKDRIRALLEENKDNAFLSLRLFQLRYYDLNYSIEHFTYHPEQWIKAESFFKELGFKSLLADLAKEIKPSERIPLSQAKGYQFKTVTSQNELNDLCTMVQQKRLCAIDTELTGLNVLENDLIGISICVEKGTSFYIPFGHRVSETQLSRGSVFAAIKPLLEDKSIEKIMHNAKFDQLAFAHYGITMQGLIFDTMIAAHLVTHDWQRIGLKYLSEHYLKEPMLSFSDVVTANGYKNFSQVPLALATEYAAADAHQTFQLAEIMKEELRKQGMEQLYYDLEFPLIEILLNMEKKGIYLDAAILAELDKKVTAELNEIHNYIVLQLDPSFKDINLNSPKQLEHLLFVHLQLPTQKKTSGKTGFSTDQEVLLELAKLHPIPKYIARYRELSKLKNTYIDALPDYINSQTGKIHTTFSQTSVATGRLSSSEPNLQNIPTDTPEISIRSAFKPHEGNFFIAADYSQIELRVLAHLSGDKNLIDAFIKNIDIHRQTASGLFDIPVEQVTASQRQIGKRINFSILYGLTPYGLSKDLDISFKDAKVYIEKYFAQYPRVQAWMEEVVEETKEHGYVTTLWGRKRYLPGIYEKNRALYELARRVAINTKAQGTAAELMKLAMIKLREAFHKEAINGHIVLQIHDELIISVAENQVEKTELLIKNVLENIVSWKVPLVVTTARGKSWKEISK